MGIVLKNNASTTLSSGISSIDTTIPVSDTDSFPSLGVGEYFYCTIESTSGTYEIVKVTQVNNTSFIAVRAQEDTIAVPFSAGARVELRVTVQALADHFTGMVEDEVTAQVALLNFLEAADIGVTVQGYDAGLAWLDGLNFTNEATFKAGVNLEIGTDVQAYNANLTTYAGIAPSANVQSFLGAANYAAMRTALSLGTADSPSFAGLSVTANTADIQSGELIVGKTTNALPQGITIKYDAGSGGDGYIVFQDDGGSLWGIRVSNTDAFRIYNQTTASSALSIDKTTNAVTFVGDVTVPAEAYGVGWNGSNEVPTKNDIYDKIETLGSGSLADGDYGDITVGGTGTTMTIDNSAVTLAKMANLNQYELIGRTTAGAGAPEAKATSANVWSLLGAADYAAFRDLLTLDTDQTPTFLGVTLTGGTVTASTPLIDATQTWNAGAVTFTGLKLNVTNTTSAAASKLIDLQIGGSSYFSVTRAGVLTLNDGTRAPSLLPFTGSYAGFQVSRDGSSPGDVHANTFWTGTNHGTLSCAYTPYGAQMNSTAAVQWSSGSLYSGADTYLYRDAANTVAQRNSTNAQTKRIYNTYTDSSNYERGFTRWSSNIFEVGTEVAGTGTVRAMRVGPYGSGAELFLMSASSDRWVINSSGHLLAYADNTYDFGSSGAFRPRRLFLSDYAVIGGTTVTASTPVLDLSQTWNNAAVAFTGIKSNITNTASLSTSKLLDLQVGGSSVMYVDRAGKAWVQSLDPTVDNSVTLGSSNWWNSANFGGTVSANQLSMGTGGSLRWSDTYAYRDGTAGYVALRQSTTAHLLRIYRTYTDTSNYERMALQSGSGYFEIAAETAGTGTDNIDIRLTPVGTGIIQAYSIVARPAISTETTGSLTSASCNRIVQCSGGVTLPSTGYTDGDTILIDPRGTARTITRPAAHTMYVAGTDSATATTHAHHPVTAMYHGSSKWTLQGQGLA